MCVRTKMAVQCHLQYNSNSSKNPGLIGAYKMIITQRSIFTNGKLAKFGMDLLLRKGKYDKFCGFAKKKKTGKLVNINPRKN